MKGVSEEREYINKTFSKIYLKAEGIANYVLGFYFIFGLSIAHFYDTWKAAVFIGGTSILLYYLIKLQFGKTRLHHYFFSAALGFFTVQFIYQLHGMVEARLILFVGAIVLMYYQRWRIMVPLGVVVAIHHLLVGYFQYIGVTDGFFSHHVAFTLSGFILMFIIPGGVLFFASKLSHDTARNTKNNAYNEFKLHEQLKNVNLNVAFAQELAGGRLTVNYDLKENDVLGASLVTLRDSLKTSRIREEEEKFFNVGLARASEILRENTADTAILSNQIIAFMVKFLNVNQGAMFILNEQDGDNSFLEMTACYAYNRKKYLNKKILIGEGLLGQSVLEKDSIYLIELPEDYINIVSGLGEAPPASILIVPLVLNGKVYGVIELASFTEIEKYKQDFTKKVGETIASSISLAAINLNTQTLLKQSQTLTEVMQSQENEMKENMNELMRSMDEMMRNQQKLEASENLLNNIFDLVPFPIFLKDSKGRYLKVNRAQASLFNLSPEDFINKSDAYFIANPEEARIVAESDRKVIEDQESINLPEQEITLESGKKYVLQTSKVPFYNNSTFEYNILGVSIDCTEKKSFETTLKLTLEEMKVLQAKMEEKQKAAENELLNLRELLSKKEK